MKGPNRRDTRDCLPHYKLVAIFSTISKTIYLLIIDLTRSILFGYFFFRLGLNRRPVCQTKGELKIIACPSMNSSLVCRAAGPAGLSTELDILPLSFFPPSPYFNSDDLEVTICFHSIYFIRVYSLSN